jgi:hypothetical protein
MAEEVRQRLQAGIASIADEVNTSHLIVDENSAKVLASWYSLEKLCSEFKPHTFHTLPMHFNKPFRVSSSKIIILIAGFLWEEWNQVRNLMRNLTITNNQLTITLFCGISDEAHANIRNDFCPTGSSTYT